MTVRISGPEPGDATGKYLIDFISGQQVRATPEEMGLSSNRSG